MQIAFIPTVHTLETIKHIHQKYAHIQEVIIQNFCAKANTPMKNHPNAKHEDMLRTIAMARLILGGNMNIQAPPNLLNGELGDYIDAGINDLGGISPLTIDFINPEKAWPLVNEIKKDLLKKHFVLKKRMPVYPEFYHLLDQRLKQKLSTSKKAKLSETQISSQLS